MSAWLVSPNHVSQLVAGGIELGLIKREDATKVGRMLTRANVKSLNARYGDTRESLGVQTYWYYQPRVMLTDVSLYKQLNCYNYQTCEYDAYERSPAYRLVKRMTTALEQQGITRDSSGYDDAPWGV